MTAARDGRPSRGPDAYFGTAFTPSPAARTEWVPRVDELSHVVEDDRFEQEPDGHAGDLENRYEWVVGMMSSFADERAVRILIAAFTLSMGICAALELTFGFAATTTPALIIQVSAAVFAFTAALWWLFAHWPRLWAAFAFVMLSDIFITLANVSANMPPEYAVGKTAFFAFLGVIAGAFFDRWMLVSHIAFSAIAVTAIIAYNVIFHGVPWLGGLVVWAPVAGMTVTFPAILYFIIRTIRLDQS